MKQAAAELSALLNREARRLTAGILGLAAANMLGRGKDAALAELGGYLTVLLASGDLLGRRRVLLAAREAGMPALPRSGPSGPRSPWVPPAPPSVPPAPPVVPPAAPSPIVPDGHGIPKIDWPDSVAQIELREPRLLQSVPGEGSVAERMGRLYAEQGFALARSTDVEVTKKVRDVLASATARGEDRMTTEAVLNEMGPWSRSYANLVYQNNMNTAYTAALVDQMNDHDVADVMGGLEFVAVSDASSTAICKAFDGTVAPASHPIWDERTTPCHHGCRSGLNLVDRVRLRRMGFPGNVHIPNPSVKPAPGFGHRRGLRLSP